MSRELMPKSGIMMPHVVINRDAAVVGVSTVDGQAGAVNLTDKYLQKTDAAATYQTKVEGATKQYVTDAINPIMTNALFKDDPFVNNDTPIRSGGANGVESVDMIKVTPENTIKIGSYASSVQGVEVHTAGRLQVVDLDDGGVETKYPIYSKRYRPEIDELPFAAIGSYVKDSKGRTIGVNRTGINSDITQMTQKVTFTQPVTVADAVGDYDAVTLRQLRNSGGGSGGPTMSGISNFGIGDFHIRDSRAFIPAFEVFSDGQLLNRADYPDLWAYAQLLSPIEDSLWLSNKFKRSRYSTGDGTTTFRVPDRNGVQEGSVRTLYARGDGGSSSANGDVFESAAPNISGYVTSYSRSSYAQVFGANYGSLYADNSGFPAASGDAIPDTGAVSTEGRYNTLHIDASRSNAIYGASADEIMGRNFVGVWTIRAHGGFVAANTSWSVINQDSAAPSLGTTVVGGKVESKYINPSSQQFARLYSTSSWGESCNAIIEAQGSATSSYQFGENGKINFRNTGKFNTIYSFVSGQGWADVTSANNADGISGYNITVNTTLADAIIPGMSIYAIKPAGYPTKVGFHHWLSGGSGFGQALITVGGDNGAWSRYFLNIEGQLYGTTQNGEFSYTRNGVSDERVKHDIKDISPEKAVNAIKGLSFKSFVYNNDEQGRVRRGVIAQQAEKVEPLYVKTRKYPGIEKGSPEIEQKELDTTPMLLDTMQVVQDLLKRIEVLEAKLAEK